ncbi:MAG TPA: FHA domain-containing protein [Bacteroidetes bacterium]|nr:FHA domain-containing protein [Bacteroidota bacterium]
MNRQNPNSFQFCESLNDIPQRVILHEGDRLNLASGQYEVKKALGNGGFGSVVGIENKEGQVFALKVLDLYKAMPNDFEQMKKRFLQGFKAGQLQSPYLVKNYFMGNVAGNPYLIMEYCRRGNLTQQIKEFASEDSYSGLGINILKGLHDLHSNGIIHRDIKPDNVLFDQDFSPKLSDFDISGFVRSRLTSKNWFGGAAEIWGTLLYAPPEQLNRAKSYKMVKPSMDMFAFGVTMYETISQGKHPFAGPNKLEENPVEYIEKVKKGRSTPIAQYRPNVSPVWQNILEKCLRPNPKNRMQTPSEALVQLDETLVRKRVRTYPTNAKFGLQVMNGEEVGKIYDLSAIRSQTGKNIIKIGRQEGGRNDIGILESITSYVSRKHLTLEYNSQKWLARDGQFVKTENGPAWKRSLNGTALNGKDIDDRAGGLLMPGDIISIGETTLKFKVL